ncbi:MAG: Holliday junction resolvase RuvX [Planctomycetes bacterium]|nr:Holliday junction resolvase RuvX [Planctomycetota bacterium]
MQFLGIDYGTKRIGLAIGNAETKLASPLMTVPARGNAAGDAAAVAARAGEYEVDGYVVGLPSNMDGTEGRQAKLSRAFGEALARCTGLPVHYFDERLSSFTAKELLEPAELSRRRRKDLLDPVAAQVMLQQFLDEYSPPQ